MDLPSLSFFVLGWGVPVAAYVILQAWALLSVRGLGRVALCAPIPLMIVVVAHMLWACHERSNLWPMTMLMVTPGVLLAVIVLWATVLIAGRQWKGFLHLAAGCASVLLCASLGDRGPDLLWAGPPDHITLSVIALAVLLQVGEQVWTRPRAPR